MQCIEKHLKDQSYDDRSVNTWVNYICEDVVQGLNDLGKPFKYIGEEAKKDVLASSPASLRPSPSKPRFSFPPVQ